MGHEASAIGRWVEQRFDTPQRLRRLIVGAACRANKDYRRFARVAELRVETGDGMIVEVRLLDQPSEQWVPLPRWIRTQRIRATVTALHRQGVREDLTCIGKFSADLEEQLRIEAGRQACELESGAQALRQCLEAHLGRLEREIEREFGALRQRRGELDREIQSSGRSSRHAANASEAQDAWKRWRESECAAIRELQHSGWQRAQEMACRVDAAEARLWQIREMQE